MKRAAEDTGAEDAKRTRTGHGMDVDAIKTLVNSTWDSDIIPQLQEYIKIPNQSPLFDPEWETNGHMDKAMDLIENWIKAQDVKGLKLQRLKEPGRTPLLFIEVPGSDDTKETVLLYGHMDKQPPLAEDWDEGLGPWSPVIKDGKLYGRGGADDGYSAFAAITAIRAVQSQGGKHARCCIVIEGCEESGSKDLPFYIDLLKDQLGTPSLVICLDSGAMTYDTLWCTTSLRGAIVGTLRVDVCTEGVHSGDASGVLPSSFRILRHLLNRIENEVDGKVATDFQVEIPAERVAETQTSVQQVGAAGVYGHFPFVEGMKPVTEDLLEVQLNRTWRAQLAVTGVEGFPSLEAAGNVLRPYSAFVLSLRIPPTKNAEEAAARLKEVLEADPPYNCKVSYNAAKKAGGWNAPAFAPWLTRSMQDASKAVFGKDVGYLGEGGSIPFMGMLGEKFPQAQFVITGVLGPGSNAHGPNETLDIECGKNVTSSMACILADHFIEHCT